ncbi:DotA/TraY family protein [Methylosinus sp. RM1]|uniref:DotA/TraY family protein n=1 Tax=Methylosinus sp. RM1 TaxID=2583817 RepID=UPI00140A8BB8|nr:DotA/TraY family protein [Methylosinus sp. RM1]
MSRRIFPTLSIALIALACGAPALAQSAAPAAPNYDVSWSALDPGLDWAAEVIKAVFPINGSSCNGGAQSATCTGSAATVIGELLGRFTGFSMALGMFYVCYLTIWNIYRTAETSNLLTNAMTSMFVVRIGFAAIMMFPITSGFSIGQAAVVQTSMWGIGMAGSLFKFAIKAIGPDAMVIATPIVPGTKNIVLGVMENELCRAFVNEATANPQIAPAPTPTLVSGSITWAYSLSPGNQTGSPSCGTITVNQPSGAQQPIAGVNTDMTAKQKEILQNVITSDIRPVAESVAKSYWQTKQTSALTPLLAAYQNATRDYTQQLTSAASDTQKQLQNAIKPQDARAGKLGLINNTTTDLSTLGWASAGSYYLTFAQLNGRTLSLLNDLPIVNGPSYSGWSNALKTDLAPLIQASDNFLAQLRTYVNTADGANPPAGNADTFGNAAAREGGSWIERVFRSINLNEPLLNYIANSISPTSNQWSDPFGSLITLGQYLMTAALTAYGLAIAASSGTVQTGAAAFALLTGNFAGAAAAAGLATVSDVFKALLTPLFFGLLALLIPGIMIAYVLPMIPWVMWIAGVTGYLILVIEAVIAVPLMMVAHMTFDGEGLHGRAVQVYELLFNVLFRPVLMLLGLFAGYFVFSSVSWLIRISFGVAVHFVLERGWFVTNLIGLVVLLAIFVLLHIVVAIKAFGLISLIPHHVPKMLGFSPANRVDMDEFSKAAAWTGTEGTIKTINRYARNQLSGSAGQSSESGVGSSTTPALSAPRKQLTAPRDGSAKGGSVDSTLSAQTDIGDHNKEA